MASAVYTESQTHAERRPLSICLEAPPSSSPFPSPSSSFLPPPTPGAHEFAMKPAPAGRNSRKASLVPKSEDEARSPTDKPPDRLHANGAKSQWASSPTTPTPRDVASLPLPPALPSPSSLATTPTLATTPLPPSSSTSTFTSTSTSSTSTSAQQPPKTPTTPLGPSFHPTPLDTTTPAPAPAPTPNRPAPPSPGVSRRISSISTASARSKSSRSSRPPSAAVSRANSTRKSQQQQQPLQPQSQVQSQQHAKSTTTPLPSSPRTFTFASATSPHAVTATTTPRVFIHVRDFAYARTDERFQGLGAHVPRANRVARLNRRLRAGSSSNSSSSSSSSEEGGEEEQEGWEDVDAGSVDAAWDMLRRGWKGAGFANGNGNGGGGGPSQAEMDWNFRDGEGDGEGEEEEGEEEDQGETPLWPGLYRALYAFQPEGTAEMALEEDQVVRVVGRGGGVGWAVVVDESADTPDKHALVPEGYLTPVRMDWEDEDEDEDEEEVAEV